MTYGAYPLVPVPLMNINIANQKNEAGKNRGQTFNINLRGTLVQSSGIDTGIILIDGMQDDLVNAFSVDGRLFEVKCDASILLRCYPRISEINFEEGIWVNRSDYTISMEFDELAPGSGETPFVQNTSEEWQLEYVDERASHTWTLPGGTGDYLPYQLRLTHNLSAQGKAHYTSAETLGQEPWIAARDWVTSRAGIDWTKIQNSGTMNFDISSLGAFDHVRSVTINEEAGNFSLNESWIVLSSGNGLAGRGLEDYNINIRTSKDTGITSIGIDRPNPTDSTLRHTMIRQ